MVGIFLQTFLPLFTSSLEKKTKAFIYECFDPQSGSHLSSTLAGLQAEKEVLLRSARDQEAELNSLRQQAQLHQSSLEQERQRSSMELGNLHNQLQQQVLRRLYDCTVKLFRISSWLVSDDFFF